MIFGEISRINTIASQNGIYYLCKTNGRNEQIGENTE